MNNGVRALTVYNDELIAGGDFTTAGEHVSAYWACWGTVPGDYDGDVDLYDFAGFDLCLAGPGGGLGAGCGCLDFDSDNDVDLGDFADFEVVFTGSLP